MKFLKALAFTVVLTSVLSMGACAHKKETMSTSTGSTHGYSK